MSDVPLTLEEALREAIAHVHWEHHCAGEQRWQAALDAKRARSAPPEGLVKALDDALYDASVLRTESVRLTAPDARAIRAALATPASPAPLDVERLAKALHRLYGDREGVSSYRYDARNIAAEYERSEP